MHAVAGAYRRVLPNGLVIASARAEHAAQLESLQRVVFPTLADEERFKAAHYLKHFELFPAGQFVGLDGDRVVAATATIRLHFDFTDRSHTFADIIQGGWLTSHQPDGGNPLTCVAAIAAIEMMRQPAFLARVERIGAMLRETLEGWKSASSAHRRRPRPGLDDADRAGEGPRDQGARARRDAGDHQGGVPARA